MKDFAKSMASPLYALEKVLNGRDLLLPGHKDLEVVRQMENYLTPTPDDAQKAAVVLLVHATHGYPSIIFIQRTNHLPQDKHRGQIAFPGGKLEDDESLKQCAFREMHEEIGIWLPPSHPVTRLTPLYISVSNFLVQPYIAIQEHIPTPTPNPAEVAAVIDSPLTDHQNRYKIKRKDIRVRDIVLNDVPYYDIDGHTLWGATALIFAEFLEIFNLQNS